MDLRRVLDELRPYFSLGSSSLAGTDLSCSVEWRKKLHSLYISGSSADRDDLIFYVRWLNSEKKEEVKVFRKDSASLPGPDDTDVLWDQSFYLNLLMHEFEYHVTCGAVTLEEDTARIDKTLMSISQRVYPSTSKQRMDKRKGHCVMVYPNIIFSLDNFQELFSELHVRAPGEKISFQLQAVNADCKIKQTIFVGAIDYEILIKVYTQKAKEENSFMFKMKHFSRMLKSSSQTSHTSPTRYYIKMEGPNSKGCAEVALYRKDLVPQDGGSTADSMTTNGNVRMHSSMVDRDSMEMRDSQNSQTVEAAEDSHARCASEFLKGGNDMWRNAELKSEGDVGPGRTNQTQNSVQPQLGHDFVTQNVRSDSSDGGGSMPFASFSESELSPLSAAAEKSPTLPLIYANLTYIELPWHSILQDILDQE